MGVRKSDRITVLGVWPRARRLAAGYVAIKNGWRLLGKKWFGGDNRLLRRFSEIGAIKFSSFGGGETPAADGVVSVEREPMFVSDGVLSPNLFHPFLHICHLCVTLAILGRRCH